MKSSSASEDPERAHALAAFEFESNLQGHYQSFAVQAAKDTLLGVARLFRVASYCKGISVLNHAYALRRLGAEPSRRFPAVDVKTTLENLRQSRANELLIAERMYPAFLTGTRLIRSAAPRNLIWALESAKSLAGLFGEAVMLVESGEVDSWITKPPEFYVRAACGYVSTSSSSEHCRMCEQTWGGCDLFGQILSESPHQPGNRAGLPLNVSRI